MLTKWTPKLSWVGVAPTEMCSDQLQILPFKEIVSLFNVKWHIDNTFCIKYITIIFFQVCVLPVCVKQTGTGRLSAFTSYITQTGYFTPGFRIPAERPPQTLWVVPARRERHSQPAETPRLNFCRLAAKPNLSNGGKLWQMIFYFLSFFFSVGNKKTFPAESDSVQQFFWWCDLCWLAKRGRTRFRKRGHVS